MMEFQKVVLSVLEANPFGIDIGDVTRKVAKKENNENIGHGTVGGALKRLRQDGRAFENGGLWFPSRDRMPECKGKEA